MEGDPTNSSTGLSTDVPATFRSSASQGRPVYKAPKPRGQQETASSSGLVTPSPPINGNAQAPNMYQQLPYRQATAAQSRSKNRNDKAIGLSYK